MRRGFGLRPRLLLALVATSAITLGTAALALFGPLQDRLREQARDSLRTAALTARPALERSIRLDDGEVAIFGARTPRVADTLSQRTGARVALYRYSVDPDAPGLQKAYDTGTTEIASDDVYRVVIDQQTVITSRGDAERIASPLRPRGRGLWIVALRQTDTGAADAAGEVRTAFGTAAIIGLGVALVLAFLVSGTLSARLSRLRRAALRLASEGTVAPAPIDTRRDEIGDLARALAAMQVALRRQEEARRTFVATASHELRTPITSMAGNLELLAEDLESGRIDVDDAREQIAGARGQLARLQALATELLDLSRLDAGVEMRREPIELGELVRAVSAEFELRARERKVDLRVVHPDAPVWAGGDPGALARILRILLDNALRFSPAGETIRVEAAYHGEQATLEIADHGPGVPAAERELIFERFQRGSATGGAGGFGLGLAIGREMAERLGGNLTLEDSSGGATFVCRLPIEMPTGSGGTDRGGGNTAAGGGSLAQLSE